MRQRHHGDHHLGHLGHLRHLRTGPSPEGVFPVVLARTGGIAGFADRLTVAADGRAEPSTKRGRGRRVV